MKTLILDGSAAHDLMAARVSAALQDQLEGCGWDYETVAVREMKIGNCAGDFFCWVRNPGVCNVNDDNRVIAKKIVQSDLVVYLTPVTFGGYSSELKRMVDHQIQDISPMFAIVNGEIHHQKRYASYPNLLAIGWMPEANPQAESIFRHLVQRNALNMYSKTTVCGVVIGQPSNSDLIAQTGSWIAATASASSSPAPALPTQPASLAEAAPVRRAVLLVGSPRTKKSTSASLGDYLFEQLQTRGVEAQTFYLHTTVSSAERMQNLYSALDSADLVVLAFPLYVDSLPAPVLSALEKIAAHRALNPTPARFAAIANCGFPEARHNDTALAICAEFARAAGFDWMGSLSLGGGEGLIHGAPLKEMDGRAIPIMKSLEIAAEALAVGKPIPQPARDMLAKTVIPNWLYRLFGGFGWKRQAKRYGVNDLLARPYRKN